ncbi:hypothetical protein DEO72_LG10g2109 [Vigna unguiculata]|uniref:Uncharacterized protein n=1 Tax=Vigna unguiculata TaxID=3917 RepID=A0A4D6NFZ6_VIGUN|nr:hypothetical protein DEO72_LG10g2109 [Vigna unguiculata]
MHSRPASRPTARSGRKVLLRRESSLAQASSFRLGKSSKSGNKAFASSRLGETSSPERDGLSLKTEARRLSDSSGRF